MHVKLPAIAMILLLVALVSPLAVQAAQSDTGKLCLLAYDDANGNGVQDKGEGLVPGVVFTVSDNAHVVASHTTDESGVPFCFDIAPGEYRVTELDSPGRHATAGQSWQVTVTAGALFDVNYGSRIGEGKAAAGSIGSVLWGLSGIVLFVGAAAVAGYVVVRGRR